MNVAFNNASVNSFVSLFNAEAVTMGHPLKIVPFKVNSTFFFNFSIEFLSFNKST